MPRNSFFAQRPPAIGSAKTVAVLLSLVLSGSGGAQTAPVGFWEQSQERVDAVLKPIPPTDNDRLLRLRESFSHYGCSSKLMQEQEVRRGAGKNLVCSLPGSTADEIVILAHYEHEGAGEGAIEGWSGAVLLPILYKSLQAEPRHHTFVFAALSGTEGAQQLLGSWDEPHRHRIKAVIAIDALGLGPVQFHLFPGTVSAADSSELNTKMLLGLSAERVSHVFQHPTQTNQEPMPALSVDDTKGFRDMGIPAIFVHSVSRKTAALPGSAQDTVAAIKAPDYHDDYLFLSYYLCSLDPYLQ